MQIRFQKLHEENLIQYKNNEIVLTLSGKFFIRFMNIFSKCFNITIEGYYDNIIDIVYIIPAITAANMKNGQILILSATAPETIEAVAQTNMV